LFATKKSRYHSISDEVGIGATDVVGWSGAGLLLLAASPQLLGFGDGAALGGIKAERANSTQADVHLSRAASQRCFTRLEKPE